MKQLRGLQSADMGVIKAEHGRPPREALSASFPQENGDRLEPSQGAWRPVPIAFLKAIVVQARAGTEGHLIRLVRSLDRERFSPAVISLQHAPFVDAWQDPRVPLTSLDFRSIYSPRDWVRILALARRLRRFGVGIVELHSPEAQFVGAIAARLAGSPVVIGGRRSLGYNHDRKARLQLRLTNRLLDCVLTNCDAVANHCQSAERIPRERIRVIHGGVDVDRFAADTRPTARDAPVQIVLTANLRAVKNHALLLRAVAPLLAEGLRPEVVLLGSGERETNLRQLVADLSLAKHVRFVGSQESVAPFLAKADIGCLVSTSEGFPNAVLEYMAAGLPVVATDVGGCREAVVQDETGYLVSSGDETQLRACLRRLLADRALRERLGQAGRARVEDHFSLPRTVAAHQTLYEELLASRR